MEMKQTVKLLRHVLHAADLFLNDYLGCSRQAKAPVELWHVFDKVQQLLTSQHNGR